MSQKLKPLSDRVVVEAAPADEVLETAEETPTSEEAPADEIVETAEETPTSEEALDKEKKD